MTAPKTLYDKIWNDHVVHEAEDGIRDVERSRGLGDVYKRQVFNHIACTACSARFTDNGQCNVLGCHTGAQFACCLLYTSPSPRDLSTSRMPSSA